MKQNEIIISRKHIYALGFVIFAILLILVVRFPFSGLGLSPNTSIDSSNLVAGSPEKFAFLSGHGGQRSVGST